MDALEAINNRHGVLCFDPRPVELDKLEAVLRAAAAAPSPANLQPWTFLVVTDPDRLQRVTEYLRQVQFDHVFKKLLGLKDEETARLMEYYPDKIAAPCFIFICLQPKADFALEEHKAVLREWYLLCLGAATANLMNAATALGLGTRWFGGFTLDQGGKVLNDMFNIPSEVEVVAATPLGYHCEELKQRPYQDPEVLSSFIRGNRVALGKLLRGKLPLSEVVYHNSWGSG